MTNVVRPLLAVLLVTGISSGNTPRTSSDVSRSGRLSSGKEIVIEGRRLDVEWQGTFLAEIVDPAPAPTPDEVPLLPVHGPAVSITATPVVAPSGAVSWHFGCEFEAWDNDGYNWDWTYEARLRDPNGNQVAFRTDWVSQKPSILGSLSRDLSDPAEGNVYVHARFMGRLLLCGAGWDAGQCLVHRANWGDDLVERLEPWQHDCAPMDADADWRELYWTLCNRTGSGRRRTRLLPFFRLALRSI